MELNALENEILIDIYDADMLPGMTFDIENYKLKEEDQIDKKHEFAYYLGKLKRLGFINYEEKEAFFKSGSNSIKYDNNVTIICENKIHIDSKGIKLVDFNYSNSEIQKEMNRCG